MYFQVNSKGFLRNVIRDGVSMAKADQLITSKPHYTFFVSGLPNTGKSSFINIFRKEADWSKNKLKVGPEPGVTRNISNRFLLMPQPRVYCYDTPGVNMPRHAHNDTIFKLAVCGCVPHHIVGTTLTADYLLFWLNRKEEFGYAGKVGLAAPSNNITEVLAYLARKRDLQIQGKPDIHAAAQHWLNMFNSGELGRVILEDL